MITLPFVFVNPSKLFIYWFFSFDSFRFLHFSGPIRERKAAAFRRCLFTDANLFTFYILSFTMVRAIRFFFSSTLTTQTFTTSPTLTTSPGLRMNRSAIREICTRPSW